VPRPLRRSADASAARALYHFAGTYESSILAPIEEERKIEGPAPAVFDYAPHNEKQPTDYTGLIIVAMLAPVFVFFTFLDKADMGLAACIVLGVSMVAIKLRWKLRKHVWFWATILFIFALHVPLVLIARWPQGSAPTIAYSMPIGIADFFIILGSIALAEKIFAKNSSSNDQEE
jgi:hypothetical protein